MSGRERPKWVLWVPDLASETGWSGFQVYEEAEEQPRTAASKVIGFKMPKNGAARGRASLE